MLRWEAVVGRLTESPPSEVASRIRRLAAGVTDPADAAKIEHYADKVERETKRIRNKPLFRSD